MKLSRFTIGNVQTSTLRHEAHGGSLYLSIVARGTTDEAVNLALLDALEELSEEIQKAKISLLQAPKNKCGSCVHFRYLNQPVDTTIVNDLNGRINGVCLQGSSAVLRDSQYVACTDYDRKLSKGAVEEWEEDF